MVKFEMSKCDASKLLEVLNDEVKRLKNYAVREALAGFDRLSMAYTEEAKAMEGTIAAIKQGLACKADG